MTITCVWNGLSDFQEKSKRCIKADLILLGHVVSSHRVNAEMATKGPWPATNCRLCQCILLLGKLYVVQPEHLWTCPIFHLVKACSETTRSHKRSFPGTLVWPLSHTGILPLTETALTSNQAVAFVGFALLVEGKVKKSKTMEMAF